MWTVKLLLCKYLESKTLFSLVQWRLHKSLVFFFSKENSNSKEIHNFHCTVQAESNA
jgi:hypothetical protein